MGSRALDLSSWRRDVVTRPPIDLVLATGNAGKAREFAALLLDWPVRLRTLADFPEVRMADERGETLEENARAKARDVARQLNAWVLADDTGLFVDALGGAPGVRSARYAGATASPADNRALLLERLAPHPEPWTARFLCRLALADPAGAIVAEATGESAGAVRRTPCGTGGFGYDVLFEVAGTSRRLAELSDAETARLGHRGQAVRALRVFWPALILP